VIDENRGLFEKHLQTALLAVLGILVLWFGNTTLETRDKAIVIALRLESLEIRMGEKMLDRYTGTQAKSHVRFHDLQMNNMEDIIKSNTAKINEFETRIDALEKARD
jgi:hypothetical protein